MLILLQILLLSCSISVIVLNEKQFKTASLSLLVHSTHFGLNYRRSQIAFYLMSILTCLPGFFIPIKIKGEFRVLYGYLFLGCLHFALLVVNGSLHYTLYSASLEVFNTLNASHLFTIQGIYYDGNDVIDVIQRKEKCCGVDGPLFWSKYTTWANLDLAQFNYKMPKSCCNKKHCSLASKRFNELTAHKKGCRQYLFQDFETLLRYNWKFPLGISITQLLIVLLCIIIIKLQKSEYTEEEKENDENEKRPMLFWKRLGRKRKEGKPRRPWFWFFKSGDENGDEGGDGDDVVKKLRWNRLKRKKDGEKRMDLTKFKGQQQNDKEDTIGGREVIDDDKYQRQSRHSSFSRKSTISDQYQASERLSPHQLLPPPPHSPQHSRRLRPHQLKISTEPIRRSRHDEIYDRYEKFHKESASRRADRHFDDLAKEREYSDRQNIHISKDTNVKKNNLQNLKRADDYSARTVEGFLEPTIGRENELDRKKELDLALSKVDKFELSIRKKRLEALRKRRRQEMKKLERLSREEEIEKEKLRALKREVLSEYLSKL